MKRRILPILLLIPFMLVGPSAMAAITAGMSVDEMVADIVAGMESGASCADTKAAITQAVEWNNENAPALVAALAARKDTGCYDDVWLAQRVADRIESPYDGEALLYGEEACAGAYSVVQAVVAGFDEIDQHAQATTEEEKAALLAALAGKMHAVVQAANTALGGDTAAGNVCVEEVLAGAASGIGDEDTRAAAWAALAGEFDQNSPLAWVAESYTFVTSYPPQIYLALRSLRTVNSPDCTDPVDCTSGPASPN